MKKTIPILALFLTASVLAQKLPTGKKAIV